MRRRTAASTSPPIPPRPTGGPVRASSASPIAPTRSACSSSPAAAARSAAGSTSNSSAIAPAPGVQDEEPALLVGQAGHVLGRPPAGPRLVLGGAGREVVGMALRHVETPVAE